MKVSFINRLVRNDDNKAIARRKSLTRMSITLQRDKIEKIFCKSHVRVKDGRIDFTGSKIETREREREREFCYRGFCAVRGFSVARKFRRP